MPIELAKQSVDDPDAVSGLNKLALDPRFREIFTDNNVTAEEVKKIELPEGATKLDLNNATTLKLTPKEYVAIVRAAQERDASSISASEYIAFMREVTKPSANIFTSPPEVTNGPGPSDEIEPDLNKNSPWRKALRERQFAIPFNDQSGSEATQKGIDKLAETLKLDQNKFPIALPWNADATLSAQENSGSPRQLAGEIPLRPGLYYPVIVEQDSNGKTTARIPNLNSEDEIVRFAQAFPSLAELNRRVADLVPGSEIANSGFAKDGQYYIVASLKTPEGVFNDRLFAFSNNNLREIVNISRVLRNADSADLSVQMSDGSFYNFIDMSDPSTNGKVTHIVGTAWKTR